MVRYVVCASQLKPSNVKGQLPDILYQYIAIDSMIPWHYTFTRNKEDAYYFEEDELDEVKKIADLWQMDVKKIEG